MVEDETEIVPSPPVTLRVVILLEDPKTTAESVALVWVMCAVVYVPSRLTVPNSVEMKRSVADAASP